MNNLDMDPVDLSEVELTYELQIRGITAAVDHRTGTRTLRTDLESELKGLIQSPTKKLAPYPAEEYLNELQTNIGGLISELRGALNRNDYRAVKVLLSKLSHYRGRANRLAGTNSEEVAQIEKLQCEINEAIKEIKECSAAAKVGVGKTKRTPPQLSTGAIPKIVSDARPTVQVQSIDAIGTERTSSEIVVQQNERAERYDNRNENQANFENLNRTNNGFNQDLDNIFSSETTENREQQQNRNSIGRSEIVTNMDRRRNIENDYRQNENNRVMFRNNNASRNYNENPQPRVNEYRGRPSINNFETRPQGRGPTSHEHENLDFERAQQSYVHRSPRGRNPVAEWNITFSGDNKDMSLNDFLSQVTLMARAEKVSHNDLLSSAIYLFTGSAKIWYRAFYPYYRSWNELVVGLKTQFLPVDYDFWLLKELDQRRQGEQENFGIYFAAMEMLFRNLSYRMEEQQKLDIVMRNMLPMYAERLALEDIVSMTQLAAKCKRIEEVKYRINRQFVPQIHRRDLLEPAFSYTGSNMPRHRVFELECVDEPDYVQVHEISNPRQRTNLCYNCGTAGHRFNQCRQERQLFCYRCGLVGYVTRNCKRCQNNNSDRGNGNASSAMGPAASSQLTQAPNHMY